MSVAPKNVSLFVPVPLEDVGPFVLAMFKWKNYYFFIDKKVLEDEDEEEDEEEG